MRRSLSPQFNSETLERAPLSRPKVIVNFAMTFDAKVTTSAMDTATFTSAVDKRRLLRIRALGDAVMVGKTTAIVDHMSLGLPDAPLKLERIKRSQSPYPLRVLISNSGLIPDSLEIFKYDFSPIVIFSSKRIPERDREKFSKIPQVHLYVDQDSVSLPWALEMLQRSYKVKTVVCEGGPTLARALANLNLIDELYLTITPKLFGGIHAPGILGSPSAFLKNNLEFSLAEMEVLNDECYLHYVRV
jgi:riboflavin-specific deaminase-like protein